MIPPGPFVLGWLDALAEFEKALNTEVSEDGNLFNTSDMGAPVTSVIKSFLEGGLVDGRCIWGL